MGLSREYTVKNLRYDIYNATQHVPQHLEISVFGVDMLFVMFGAVNEQIAYMMAHF